MTQTISNGLINVDLNRIIQKSNYRATILKYTLIIHTEEHDVEILNDNFHSIEVLRNYATNIVEFVRVDFNMFTGDYLKDILPYRDNLECTIEELNTTSNEIRTHRYKLIIGSDEIDIDTDVVRNLSKEELNQSGMKRIKAQALPRTYEVLRTTYVDGIYRDTDLSKVIKREFQEAFTTNFIEGSPLDITLELYQLDNISLYKHINLPTGVTLLDLPTYLQETSFGLYNGKVGTFLQSFPKKLYDKELESMFIYPIYSSNRRDDEDQLIIYIPNNKALEHIENTFSVDGKVIEIIGANVTSKSLTAKANISQGESIVFANPDSTISRSVDINNNKILPDGTKNTKGEKNSERKDQINKSSYLGNKNNIFEERSNIIVNTMDILEVSWLYCDIDLLKPGMGVTVVTEQTYNNKSYISKQYGTLQVAYSTYDRRTTVMRGVLVVAVLHQKELF